MATPKQVRRRGRYGLVIATAIAAALFVVGAAADDIANNIEGTAEVMALNEGGPTGSTVLTVVPKNGDGKNGCNLTGSTTLVLSVASDNTSVATVSPTSLTFASCGDEKTVTVTPQSAGSANVALTQVSNNTGGTFNLGPAAFRVEVAPPPNTAPDVTVTGVEHGASYAKGSVPAAGCSVVDAEDGNSTFPATLSAITGTYASDGLGNQTATCSYTDAGGLTETVTATYTIYDPSAPSIGSTLAPASPDGNNGWYRSDVSLTWNVDEPQSPNSLVKTGCVNQSITADQAATTYSCAATSAGGSTGPVDVTIKRDAHAPNLSCPSGPSGWQAANVTLNCSAADVGPSGLANAGDASFPLSTNVSVDNEDASASTGSKTVSDNAGNSDSIGPFSFMVDRKGPSVNLTCPTAPVIRDSSTSASWTATDSGSGVSGTTSGTIPLDTSAVNLQTASLPAGFRQDNVGNESAAASCTYSVVHDWSGFFQPVDNKDANGNYVLNKAKAGSTVPVKFSLRGDQGLGIFASGYPQTAPLTCSASGTDAIEEYSTATVSGLKYDPVADQYVYNWKTDGKWAGTCRQLIVKLNDGTYHRANFNFFK